MRIHHLQHVPFEGPGSIEPALREKGHVLSATHLYDGQTFPDVSSFDGLIVMGGPMGIYDYDQFDWLKKEKQFIDRVMASGKPVLGICLGAQLIADVLGARVYPNPHKEIGWYDVTVRPKIHDSILAKSIPSPLEVFHWHGDTFGLPAGALNIAYSEACDHQGFILEDRILALQFHLETTRDSAAALIENGQHELDGSKYVQTAEEMLASPSRFTRINRVMEKVLDVFFQTKPN